MTLIYLLAVIGATPYVNDEVVAPPTKVLPPRAPLHTLPAPPPSRRTRAAVPKGNPGGWVTTIDYPITALREERGGTTNFRLLIGEDGIVKNCEITISSGHADLDATTCNLVSERARFSPALDAEGNATEGQYSGRIRWVIPDVGDPNFDYSIPKAANTTFSIEISENGEVTNCKVKSTDPETEKNGCSDKTIFTPYVDAEGNTKRVQLIVSSVIKVIELDSLPEQEKPDAPNK